MNTPDDKVELASDLKDMSAEQQDQRRRALRSMLTASEARQQQIKRSRPPTMAVGVRVLVKSGPHKGRPGTILDADFIHGRALVDFPEEQDSHWVEFPRLTGDNSEAEGS